MTIAPYVYVSTAFAMLCMFLNKRGDVALALAIPTIAYFIAYCFLIDRHEQLIKRAKNRQKRRDAIASIKAITGVALDENATAEDAEQAIRDSGYPYWRKQNAIDYWNADETTRRRITQHTGYEPERPDPNVERNWK